MSASSRRPYLIRAMYDWAVDNSFTPHLVVTAGMPGVNVPSQYVSDGKITLNIGPRAAHGLHIGNDEIRFSARFGGQPHVVNIPPAAVVAIYARENGEGIVFGEIEDSATAAAPKPPDGPTPGPAKKPKGAHLKVVK
jgi:stringent starvation protein B